ncbi:MAG: zinc ribbon domain-containing protein [Desulfurococcales archaeon]|nr:zinc ribbon domain-containing protein [Desulfurococcales archaeon]
MSRIVPRLAYVRIVGEAYVFADSGLPVEYKGLSREEAEELAAWSTQVVLDASKRLGLRGPTLAVFLRDGDDLVVEVDGEESLAVITAKGQGEAVARALAGRGPRCEACGADLSQAVVVCPRCGARNPFAATHCRRCGAPLRLRRCPRCGALIDSEGRRASRVGSLLEKPARVEVVEASGGPGS